MKTWSMTRGPFAKRVRRYLHAHHDWPAEGERERPPPPSAAAAAGGGAREAPRGERGQRAAGDAGRAEAAETRRRAEAERLRQEREASLARRAEATAQRRARAAEEAAERRRRKEEAAREAARRAEERRERMAWVEQGLGEHVPETQSVDVVLLRRAAVNLPVLQREVGATPRECGLWNPRFDCFMNSVLQVLVRLPPLRAWLARSGRCERRTCMVCAVRRVLEEMAIGGEGEHGRVDEGTGCCCFCKKDPKEVGAVCGVARLKAFRKLVRVDGVLGAGLRGGGQECAGEFLAQLLQQMATDAEEHADEGGARVGLLDLWEHVERGRRVCTECRAVSDKLCFGDITAFIPCRASRAKRLPRHLQVNGPNHTTLEVLLRERRCAKVTDGACVLTWECHERTGGVYVEQYFPEWAPPVLCLQVQRGAQDGQARWKIDTVVEFPVQLHWAERAYDLHGVVQHHGERLDSGHFTSVVRVEGEGGGWLECDDGVTHGVSLAYVKQMQAYLLVYLRTDNATCPLLQAPTDFNRPLGDIRFVHEFVERHRALGPDTLCDTYRDDVVSDDEGAVGGVARGPVLQENTEEDAARKRRRMAREELRAASDAEEMVLDDPDEEP